MMAESFNFEAFVDGYITAALWSDCMPPESDPDGESGGCEGLTLRPGARDRMIERGRLREFVEANDVDLLAYVDAMGPWSGTDSRGYIDNEPAEARAGHDLWLTRNGHGAGFWDRDLGELGDRLTKVG